MTTNQYWEWIDVPLGAYVNATFQEISGRFRGPNPVGLITKLEAIPELLVINLLTPVNSVFWGCPQKGTFYNQFGSSSFVTLVCQRAALIRKELKASGISAESKAMYWLGDILQSIQLSRKREQFAEPNNNTGPGFLSISIPNASLGGFQLRLQQELTQFGDYSFFPFDECDTNGREEFTENEVPEARLVGTGYTHFAAVSELLDSLVSTVGAMEAGEAFDYNLPTFHISHGGVSFYSSILNGLTVGDIWEMERKILSYRARLVRLLGWPSHFEAIQQVISAESSSGGGVLSYGITSPYNVAEELRSYISEMTSRYPVLKGS